METKRYIKYQKKNFLAYKFSSYTHLNITGLILNLNRIFSIILLTKQQLLYIILKSIKNNTKTKY